jgi:hypothetical protein
MPLTFRATHPKYDGAAGAVQFLADDQTGRCVTCAASEEGLADLSRSAVMGEAVLAIFLDNRALIERIATEKYDRKRIRADGVVMITSGDLAPYG